MIYSFRGAAAAMMFVGGLSIYTIADRGMNYDPAKGSVYMIDRTCDFVETSKEGGHTTARSITDSCNSTDEWAEVKTKRNKKVSGSAVIHLSYTAPQDGSYHTATLKFDGGDDEFYELKAGDEIDVLVSKEDPKVVIKA